MIIFVKKFFSKITKNSDFYNRFFFCSVIFSQHNHYLTRKSLKLWFFQEKLLFDKEITTRAILQHSGPADQPRSSDPSSQIISWSWQWHYILPIPAYGIVLQIRFIYIVIWTQIFFWAQTFFWNPKIFLTPNNLLARKNLGSKNI